MSEVGEVYADFIYEELKQEAARRVALDGRATFIVSTSGALTTLLLGVGAVSRGTHSTNSPLTEIVLVLAIVGVVAFVAAAALGIAGSRLIEYDTGPDAESLHTIRTALWNHDPPTARNVVAWYRAKSIVTLRDGNNRKATLIQFALISQATAVIALASAVALAAIKG